MSASMTATASQRQGERHGGRVGMDPYLVESGWHSSSRRATPAAVSPPRPPARPGSMPHFHSRWGRDRKSTGKRQRGGPVSNQAVTGSNREERRPVNKLHFNISGNTEILNNRFKLNYTNMTPRFVSVILPCKQTSEIKSKM